MLPTCPAFRCCSAPVRPQTIAFHLSQGALTGTGERGSAPCASAPPERLGNLVNGSVVSSIGQFRRPHREHLNRGDFF
jgi:hypothetical protein